MRTLASIGIALLLLAGCTSNDKPEKKPPKASKTAKPTPASPTEAGPAEAIRTDAPMPSPATGQWWCLCHQSETDAGPVATTSCRELESECRDLEKRIAQGGRGLVAGSLSEGCRAIKGVHPGDALGGREVWSPSKLAGAWTSEGSCLLGDVPLPEGGSEAGSEAGSEPNFDVLAHEAFGQLRLGMAASEVQALLGAPQTKGGIEEEGATGNFVQEWDYRDVGLNFFMSADTRDGAQTLASVRATAPSKLKTKRGIAIGNDRAAVEKAYGDVEDKQDSDKTAFVAGSIYGGVIFSFEAGKVSEIFMGAAAE